MSTSTSTIAVDAISNSESVATQTAITLKYASANQLIPGEGENRLALFSDVHRPPVSFAATVRDPLLFREALATLYAVVGSDQRYVPKDRSTYLAYQRLRKSTANMAAWEAQQAYFEWLSRNAPDAETVLDPLVSVHEDRLLFEVFSKDEGCYACLSLTHGHEEQSLLETEAAPACGTTNLDLNTTLLDGVMALRSYRKTAIVLGQQPKSVEHAKGAAIEKPLRVPDAWLRSFLQVQSAAMLAHDRFSLNPIDLYNTLRYLRMHGDIKRKRRGLRIELVPGEPATLVLEPWEHVIPSTSEIYRGKTAQVVRLWGRRRLLLLQRLLPLVDSVQVHTLGSGLPSYWVLRSPQFSFTFALTGFTAANWAQAAAFDLLLPRPSKDEREPIDLISQTLETDRQATLAQLQEVTGQKPSGLRQTLQTACQQGRVMYDLAEDVYRWRPVTAQPLVADRLQYRNNRERSAYDLLTRQNAVTLAAENRIHGQGVELTGRVDVAEDRREYRPMILLSDEGQVSRAECTCHLYRQQGLQHGPCTHLIALRLAYARRQSQRGHGRGVVTETRTFSKRNARGEHVYQLTLDRSRLKIRWGPAGEDGRLQQLRFSSNQAARDEYERRLAALETRGYLDITA